MLRVFVLDDHEVVRRGIVDLLHRSGKCQVVGEAGTASEALKNIPSLNVDVAILDARLPDGSGITVCRQLRSQFPNLGCIILTSYDEERAMLEATLAGASAYVLKQVRGSDLIETVCKVAAGENLLDKTWTKQLEQAIEESGFIPDSLTNQEKKVLALIADGLTNRQIAQELSLAEKTVKNYVTNVLSKLGINSRTQAAILVRQTNKPIT